MTKRTGFLAAVLLIMAIFSEAAFGQKIAFIEKITIKEQNVTMVAGTIKELKFEVYPAKHAEKIKAVSSDKTIATITNTGVLSALKPGKVKITLMGEISGVSASIEVTVTEKGGASGAPGGNGVPPKPVYTKGTVDLGYGVYKGDLKNGKPHGHGVLTYTEEHKIVPSKEYIAEPGDSYEGEFRDGKIAGGIGYWRHNGETRMIQT